MAIEGIPFKSDEELVAEHGIKTNIKNLSMPAETELPLEIDLLGNQQPIIPPNGKPIAEKFYQQEVEKPGFIATLGHSIKEHEPITNIIGATSDFIEHKNALLDEVPEGWTPYTMDNAEGVEEKYLPYLFGSHSPNENAARKQWIIERQADEKYYENGSAVASFLGGFINTGSFVPIATGLKYAKVGQNVMMNVMKAAPGITAQTVLTNTAEYANHNDETLGDLAINTAVGTMAGLALIGGAAGLGSLARGGEIYAARKATELTGPKGIGINFKINEDGVFQGFQAAPLEGHNVGAAEVTKAQEFLDSTFAKRGLFKIPFATNLVGILNPTVRMMTSRFTTMREFINRFADHSFETLGLTNGKANPDNFEREVWGITARSKQTVAQYRGYMAEANGLIKNDNKAQVNKALEQRMAKAPMYTEDTFGKAVGDVIVTGEASDNHHVNSAAKLISDHLEGTYKAFLRAHGLNEDILPPRTAIGYLMRNYDIDAMVQNPRKWVDVVANALKEQDELIEKLHAPIRKAEDEVKRISESILGGKLNEKVNKTEVAPKPYTPSKSEEKIIRVFKKEKTPEKIAETNKIIEHLDLWNNKLNELSEDVARLKKEEQQLLKKAAKTNDSALKAKLEKEADDKGFDADYGDIEIRDQMEHDFADAWENLFEGIDQNKVDRELLFSKIKTKDYLKNVAEDRDIKRRIKSHIEVFGKEQAEYQDIIVKTNTAEQNIQKVQNPNLPKPRNEIEDAKRRLVQAHEDLIKQLEDNPDYHDLLVDRVILKSEDRKQLAQMFEKVNVVKDAIAKRQRQIERLRTIRSKAKANSLKAATPETLKKHNRAYKEADAAIKVEKEHLDKLKQELTDEQAEMNSNAQAGVINPKFYTRDHESGHITFRNPEERPKFRQVYDSHEAREEAADSFYNTILNYTPEQLQQGMLATLAGGGFENPLSNRSILIKDTILRNAQFLSNNIPQSLSAYDLTLGKQTAFANTYRGFGTNTGGLAGITEELTKERAAMQAKIEQNPNEIERKKELAQLKKDFDRAKSQLKSSYDIGMGRTGRSRQTRRWSRNLRNFIVSTKLGGVPLTQVTDIAGIVLKNGLWPTIRDGILPSLRSFNGYIKSAEGQALRAHASHAGVALEHLGNSYGDKIWNSSSVQDVAVSGRLATGLEKVANLSGNLFGTNQIDNWGQTMVAGIAQSKIMNYMFKFKNGTLKDRELRDLLTTGIDPKIWADRFIENYHGAKGEKFIGGGHQTYWYNWKDDVVKNRMAKAIQSTVRGSVLKKGLLDAPFMSNDPIIGMLFMLRGYGFAAFARYTIPNMQRIDAQRTMGMAIMLSMGALVDPLRKLSRGEEANLDDDGMFIKALSNSSVLGTLTDIIQDINVFSGDAMFTSGDRWRDRTIAGVLGGPALGVANDIVTLGRAAGTGRITQSDLQKLLNLTPMAQPWYLRGLTNKFKEASGLPQRKEDTTNWLGE